MFFRLPSLEELEFGKVCFGGEGKTGVPGERPLRAKERTNNKLNPGVALIEHGPIGGRRLLSPLRHRLPFPVFSTFR